MRTDPVYFAHPLTTVSPRDLLLLEHLQPRPSDVTLEIGVGSGSSLFQLAGKVAELHGLDIAEGPVERLRQAIVKCHGPRGRIKLFVFDFCQPDAAAKLPNRYDLIYSCDTVEHVESPREFFTNVFRALKPGGRAFIAFPNEHPSLAHGITFFERKSDLVEALFSAGFSPEQITIQTLQMSPGAKRVLQLGWYQPRRLAKIALASLRGRQRSASRSSHAPANGKPQTFDQTDFYTLGSRFRSVAPLVNAYCWSVLKLASLSRQVFEITPAPDVIWNTSILIGAIRTDPVEQPSQLSRTGETPVPSVVH